jgi:hypothetical protein
MMVTELVGWMKDEKIGKEKVGSFSVYICFACCRDPLETIF